MKMDRATAKRIYRAMPETQREMVYYCGGICVLSGIAIGVVVGLAMYGLGTYLSVYM